MRVNFTIVGLIFTASLFSCSVPRLPSDSDVSKQNMTVGVVQREIRKGMTGGEVATVLGRPNIVTSGPNGTEVWVYDRTFSQVEAAGASTGVWFVIGTTGQSAAISRSSQSTLTVVVKFDDSKKVADVAYHQSKF
jgi:outer membrane protein assembly factor BamE (lipoprotein component of BamABCDE complex)